MLEHLTAVSQTAGQGFEVGKEMKLMNRDRCFRIKENIDVWRENVRFKNVCLCVGVCTSVGVHLTH